MFFSIATKSTRWVWPVSRGCLFLLGTWSCLWAFSVVCDCSALDYWLNTELSTKFTPFFSNMIHVYSSNNDIFPIMTFLPIWHWAHGGCDWSAEDAYIVLFHGTWSYLLFLQRSTFAPPLFCIFRSDFCFKTLFVLATFHLFIYVFITTIVKPWYMGKHATDISYLKSFKTFSSTLILMANDTSYDIYFLMEVCFHF